MSKGTMGEYRFLPIEKVIFGEGAIENIPEAVALLNSHRIAVIASNSLMGSSSLGKIKKLLGERLVCVVSGTVQHAPASSILTVADKIKEHNPDLLISFGGGTVIDTTKAIALVIGEGIESIEGFSKYAVKFEYPDKIEIPSITNSLLPHISIPTTLSAAEFSNIAGITDEQRRVKNLYIDDKLTPIQVFLDPSVTLDTPQWLWSATGLRALDHSIETVYSKKTQVVTTTLAVESIKLLNKNLRKCQEDPADIDARMQCQLAAWMSFFGVTNVMMGVSHGIGHQLGAHANVPHGVTSSIMLPHVMRYCLPVTTHEQAQISKAMGLDASEMTTEEMGQRASELVSILIQDLKLPARLRDVDVNKDLFNIIAKDAMGDLVVASSPRKVKSQEDIVQLLEQAW
ncbi:iron-containing alcohol dehydrogenase [Jeotgalibacillus soli]|uniref:Uncharacterized protein n=1 Tax=Jeotgalibacillus soli TaxID=889306 RepID=A0A0C2V8W2_9BACL|nr:iron-containing alcohol dehydrogenase [Jeotgalibacillus soli]KIL45407.1 hypothetical protein KP78_29510 [Jeotgalibacillus soli]